MQTFLPFADFRQTAWVLDRQRLGKQRVETLQIMTALLTEQGGWKQHPAVKMWRGHESWLMGYQSAITREWKARGYKDTCYQKTLDIYLEHHGWVRDPEPFWLGFPVLHRSHRSNLTRKWPEWYNRFWRGTPDYLPYFWPVD